jgi:membrane-associated phospholipid phosphatase
MYPNSQWIPWIWGGSLGIASTVAILRVAAGKHFPSDVIAGALVGSAVSYSVLKLHETDRTSLSLSVFPGWVGLYYKF